MNLKFFVFFSLFFNLLSLIIAHSAEAHAFGQQYTLPVPFTLYAYGAALAVIASFAILGFFIDQKITRFPQLNISNWFIIKFFRNELSVKLFKTISLLLFILTIATGFFGTPQPTQNFNMTFFWIIAVLGITYLTFFLGNIYSVLNPWRILVDMLEKVTEKQKAILIYPKFLGYYPALLFYFLFIWIELLGRLNPLQLSLILVNYTILNLIGYYLVGKEIWFEKCEFFSVFYSLLSRLSIVRIEQNRTYLQPPLVGLLTINNEPLTIVPFIIFMLSSTAFDGLKETQQWWNIYFSLPQNLLQELGDNAATIISTVGLILIFLSFLLLFWFLVLLLKLIGKSKLSTSTLMTNFAFSLIPIALVYNAAHYYTLLLIQGQIIIPIASDPFGKGWNLFGTSNFLPNINLIGTNAIWHSQVALILIGHIAAVFVAHLISIKLFNSPKKAFLSQIPMLVLMVFYTVAGLWILSQPLTSGF